MTVCVVAMTKGAIFGASDRMLTAGDIQFEPNAPKALPITNSIVVMFAGDASFHREVVENAALEVNDLVAANPDAWIDVRHVVDIYVNHRNLLKQKAAEQALLAPLGLTMATFLAQSAINSDLARDLAREVIQYQMPNVECIVAGVDTLGTHIYTIIDGTVRCHNGTGFAAIGSGHWHAESEIMANGHHTDCAFAETISLVYRAKRRAQTAPGVGADTDMFMVTGLGKYNHVGVHIREKLADLWDQMEQAERLARVKLHEELDRYATESSKAGNAKQETGSAAEPEAEPADEIVHVIAPAKENKAAG